MYGVIGRGEQGPIVQEMPKFGHIANLFGMCYDKGSKVVGMIEDRLGPDGFLDFIHRLHDRYRYRIIRVADLQRELEEYTGQSWDEFFKRWLYGSRPVRLGRREGQDRAASTVHARRPMRCTARCTVPCSAPEGRLRRADDARLLPGRLRQEGR